MSAPSRYQPDSQVVYTQLGEDEAVLLHLETNGYYAINETGMKIWHLLGKGKDTEAITQELTAVYDITPGDAAAHVEAFLAELSKDGLIHPR